MVERVEVTAQGMVGKGGRGIGLGIRHQPPVPVLLGGGGGGPEGWWDGEGAMCCVVPHPPFGFLGLHPRPSVKGSLAPQLRWPFSLD